MFLERAELVAAMRPWSKRVSAKTDDLDADGNAFHADIAGWSAPLADIYWGQMFRLHFSGFHGI